jgi:hypothetical protein
VRERLDQAAGSLQLALSFFPLGAEAHELLAIIQQLTNNYTLAQRSFDLLWSLGRPVYFFTGPGERVEIGRDSFRIIRPPGGGDQLGDLGRHSDVSPDPRQDADIVPASSVKGIKTDEGTVVLDLGSRKVRLAPARLAMPTIEKGPFARKYANEYAKLFERYLGGPGSDNVKLGKESLTKKELGWLGLNIVSLANYTYGLTQLVKWYNVYNAMFSAWQAYLAFHAITDMYLVLHQRQQILQYSPMKLLPLKRLEPQFREQL